MSDLGIVPDLIRDVRGSYAFCHEFYEFMKDYRQSTNIRRTEAEAAPSEADNIEAIKKLHDLLEAGILTQEEFDAKKKQLLGL